MSKPLTIAGTTYNYPSVGDPPNWGEEATDWAEAVTNTLTSVIGPGDILQSTFLPANNQVAPANVTGLLFDTSVVRAAIIEYSIYRTTNSNEIVECGSMYLAYKSTAATFELARTYAGDGGMTFTVNGSGQLQYTSSNLAGSSYSGKMKYRARALNV